MINIVSKTCEYDNCKTIPTFNYKGALKPIFCNLHKLEGMIDVKSKLCKQDNCCIKPTFNFYNQKNPIFCKAHKLDGMIDVKSKLCKQENCKKRPSHNYEYEEIPNYCSFHKLDGMINIVSKTCEYNDCKKIPHYSYKGSSNARYCNTHKLDGMINVKSKSCIYDWCDTIPHNKNYKGYCFRCFLYTFPDIPVSRNYKTKETATANFVTEQFQNFTWNIDKKVEDGCSRKRPDLMCDLGYQVLIVEVDENQHETYDCSCENKRIMQISQDIGHRPLIFIRFNPDDYLDCSGNNVSSCWTKTSKTEIIKIKNDKINEWNTRLDILKQTIEYWSNEENKTEKTIETIQLFYDQNM
jgi:hypothetical protein